MKDSLVEKLANHFIECLNIRANTDYTSNAPSESAMNDSVNDLRTDVVEDATDMLFSPSYRKEVDTMTNEQYLKYLKMVQDKSKSVMHYDKTDNAVETPENKQNNDSFLGNATNS